MEMVKPSVCTLDCPDACSLSVVVHDGRIEEIRGSQANPYTAGVLCNKVTRHLPELIHGEGRLTTPLRRTGAKGEGRFERIGWEQALDLIHERFSAAIAEHGPQCVLPLNYAGPHGTLAGGSMDLRFFHKLGASLLDRRPMCGGVRGEAWAGTMGNVPGARPEQAAAAKLVIVWGINVTWTSLHLMPVLNEAKANGAKIVVVDPRRTKVAEQAHLHLPVRPGTDVVLAWALATQLERLGAIDRAFVAEHVQGFEPFMAQARRYPPEVAAEICGVPEADIRRLAEWYATLDPAAIALGNGLERNRNGGSAARSVVALPALAGKFGVRGGGVIYGSSHSFPKNAARLARPDLVPEGTRTLNIIDAGKFLTDEALDPPIKALFIYNHNALIVHPEQNRLRRGLEREDLFTVGCDVVMTDTLAYADVVLPACSNFEHPDLYQSYGQQWLQRAEPVIPPVGESLPNTEIFRRLAARFGFDDPALRAGDVELMNDAYDAGDPRMAGMTPSEIPIDRALEMRVDGEEPILFRNVFPATPSGKIELESGYLGEKFGRPLPGFQPMESPYPLALISPAANNRITSTFGGLEINRGPAVLEMHPGDAQARGLKDGDDVRAWNDLGEVFLVLKISDVMRPGVVCSHKGLWLHTSGNGQTISALAPAHHSDAGEGACFNDARIDVAALDTASLEPAPLETSAVS